MYYVNYIWSNVTIVFYCHIFFMYLFINKFFKYYFHIFHSSTLERRRKIKLKIKSFKNKQQYSTKNSFPESTDKKELCILNRMF